MKNFTNNFKQITSRLSARWLIMALMMLVGTSSAWGWSISANRNVYLYDATTTTCNVKLQVWSNNSWDNTHNMTKLGNGVYQYKVGNEGYNNYSGFQFIKDCSTKSYVGPFYQDINSVNSCRYSDSWSFPPVWSLTIANNGTNVSKGGSGTQADPYLVPENSTVKVKVSSVGYEQNGLGIRYSWKSTGSATSYTANDTEDSFTIGAAGTVVGVVCDAKTEYNNNLCAVGCSSNTIYFKSYTTCTTATLSWANTFNGSMKVGDEVTNPASLDKAAAASSISYTSSNPDVISVNGTTLTALKSGKATITASATANDGYCVIESLEKVVTVTCDVVNTEDIKIEVVYTGDDIPSIWAWEPNNSNNNLTGGTWPGQAMTPKGNNVYSWETKPTSGESVSIIISKNGANQTNDIDDLQIGKRYKFSYDPNTTVSGSNDRYEYQLLEEDCLAPACTNPAVPSIKINENSSATICDGSTATITIDANHEAASYKLFTKNGDIYKDEKDINNKTINVSTAGTYVVRAYNATCMTESNAVTLAVDTKPIITVSEISPICAGNQIDLSKYVSASLGTLTYNEETTSIFNPTVETEYTIEAINGECSVTTTITVPVTSIPETPTISSEQASICSGSQATINIQGDADTYLLYVHDNGYTLQGNIKPEGKTFKITPQKTTTYAIKALNGESCYSNGFSNDVTINVTTTPVITGPSATQPNKEITLSSKAGANTMWETSSGSTLTPAKGAETVFTATGNGNYTINASNTANNITCSATHEIVVNDKFYIYIRRPKSGTTTYNQWYEKTNDADKGAHPWMKNGSEYKTGDDYTNNNYDGYGPESTFTDCNGYVWDAFIAPGTSFFIHAPNTFQEGGQEGYATFTQVTSITSTAKDLYYTLNQWSGGETKGTTLSLVSEPTRIPEVAVPVLSIDPVSGIICQNAEATITVTNPENGVTYTLNYEGKDQENPISYTGSEEVEYTVSEAGTYIVKAETTSGTCKGNAVSIAREIQVITTSISFEGTPYVTTPWEPITIIVNVPKGYNYTFDDTKLTQIASPDTPIKKTSGNEYTYSFPRPQEWGTGNYQTGDSWGEKTYTISATLNGVTESCGTTNATVKLQDEGNDKCTTTNP